MVKTRADSTLRTGSLGGALGGILGQAQRNINALGRQATRATKLDQVRRNINPIVPSKPIPAQNAMYFSARPADNPKPFVGDDLRAQIQKLYADVGSFGKKVGKPFDGKSDQESERQLLDIGTEGQRAYNAIADSAKGLGNVFRDEKHQYKAPERPDEPSLKEIRDNVDIALRDNTWSPQEKDQILGSYRNFVQK